MYRGACYRRLYGMCMVWLRKDIVRCRLYRQKKKRKIIRSWDWKLRVEVSMGESSLPQKTGSNDWVIEQYRNCSWTKQSWYGYSIKVKGLWNDEMQLWFNPSPLVLSQWKTCIMVTHQHICLTFLDCFISPFFLLYKPGNPVHGTLWYCFWSLFRLSQTQCNKIQMLCVWMWYSY